MLGKRGHLGLVQALAVLPMHIFPSPGMGVQPRIAAAEHHPGVLALLGLGCLALLAMRWYTTVGTRARQRPGPVRPAAAARTPQPAHPAVDAATRTVLATVSHELRTPLHGVLGLADLLLATPLADDQRAYVAAIQDAGAGLLTLTNDILDCAKLAAGRVELAVQPVDLHDCVEHALDLVAPRAAAQGLDLACAIAPDVPAAFLGDATRLRQVLLNLLANAVKFTAEGAVVLRVARQGARADGRVELVFAVCDTGIGIPSEQLDRLFQPFAQGDATIAHTYGGTGLGLAISQQLVAQMGGQIRVTSTVGQGTTFQFTLPVAAATPPPGWERLLGAPAALHGKRVLVVDDHAASLSILRDQLVRWGMQVVATGQAHQALAWLRAGELFDLAIVDGQVPAPDGTPLAPVIQALGGPQLPLLGITTLGQPALEGVAATLTRPLKPAPLYDALLAALGTPRPAGTSRAPACPLEDCTPASPRPLRILLAEDNALNQMLALRLLEQLGYAAVVAATGQAVLDALEQQPYDVVLMDVQMPELDGLETTRHIRAGRTGMVQPHIIAMTANALEGDRERCLAAGMDDYLSKPVRVADLRAALQRCP